MTTTTAPLGAPQSINPSDWSAALGFDQAQLRPAPRRLLTLAGQGSVDAGGALLHAGDATAQLALALRNVEDLLERGGMGLADVLSLTVFTTDVDAVLASYHVLTDRLAEVAPAAAPPATLVGVSRLALPGMVVEIVAQAGR